MQGEQLMVGLNASVTKWKPFKTLLCLTTASCWRHSVAHYFTLWPEKFDYIARSIEVMYISHMVNCTYTCHVKQTLPHQWFQLASKWQLQLLLFLIRKLEESIFLLVCAMAVTCSHLTNRHQTVLLQFHSYSQIWIPPDFVPPVFYVTPPSCHLRWISLIYCPCRHTSSWWWWRRLPHTLGFGCHRCSRTFCHL